MLPASHALAVVWRADCKTQSNVYYLLCIFKLLYNQYLLSSWDFPINKKKEIVPNFYILSWEHHNPKRTRWSQTAKVKKTDEDEINRRKVLYGGNDFLIRSLKIVLIGSFTSSMWKLLIRSWWQQNQAPEPCKEIKDVIDTSGCIQVFKSKLNLYLEINLCG